MSVYQSNSTKFTILPRFSFQEKGDSFILEDDHFYISPLFVDTDNTELHLFCEAGKLHLSK